MVVIRADANNIIATGHVMRCLSIADQLKKQGEEVLFILSDDSFRGVIEDRGFRTIALHNDYREKMAELPSFIPLLEKQKADYLLVDSYSVTAEYFQELAKHITIPVAYIDDMGQEDLSVDTIINYGYGAEAYHYPNATTTLLGPKYTPLREQFDTDAIEIKKEVRRVFISAGGTDNYHVITHLLKQMEADEWRNVEKSIVVGQFYMDMDQLRKRQSDNDRIHIYQNIKEMASVMKQCDLAISAAGTTISELFACGVPTIAFSIADNQLGVRNLAKDGLLLYAGDIRNNIENTVEQIVKVGIKLSRGLEDRKVLSERTHKLIDGKGTCRIASNIIERVTQNANTIRTTNN